MKKRLRKLACVALMAALLLSCISCGKTEEELAEKPEKEVITFWHYWDMTSNQRKLTALINNFNDSQDEIEVVWKYVPEEDYRKQLALSMAEGEMPDIALISSGDFLFFHNMQPFERLDGKMDGLEEYLPRLMDFCTVDGGVYGLPFEMNCTALFYNKDMFEAAGIEAPTTWEEVEQAALLTAGAGSSGLAISAGGGEGSIYTFLPILWAMGGDPVHIDSEEGKRAYSFLSRLVWQGGIDRKGANMTLKDTFHQFAKQESAMVLGNSTVIPYLAEKEPALNFGVVPVMEGDNYSSILGCEIIALSSKGNVDAAQQFLEYLMKPERIEEYLSDFGFLAPREDALEQQYEKEEWLRVFIDSVPDAQVCVKEEWWPKVSTQLVEAMKRVLLGEEVDSVLEQTQKEIDRILEDETK